MKKDEAHDSCELIKERVMDIDNLLENQQWNEALIKIRHTIFLFECLAIYAERKIHAAAADYPGIPF